MVKGKLRTSSLLLLASFLSLLACLLHLESGQSSSPMSLHPLGCLIELHLCFLLLGLSFIDDCLKIVALSLLFESLRPLFFDLLQLFVGVVKLFLHNVLLFVMISHLIIVSFKCFSVSLVSKVVFVGQLLFLGAMSAFCNLKVLSQFCDSSLEGLHFVFVSLLGLLSNLRAYFLQTVLLLLSFETNSRSLLLQIKNFLLSLLLVFLVPLSHLVEFVLLLLECIL